MAEMSNYRGREVESKGFQVLRLTSKLIIKRLKGCNAFILYLFRLIIICKQDAFLLSFEKYLISLL